MPAATHTLFTYLNPAGRLLLLFGAAVVVVVVGLQPPGCLAKENNTQLLANLRELDPCIVRAIFSFVSPHSMPPTSLDALKASCKSHQDAYRCLKEKARTAPAIIKRGVSSLGNNMQRITKKYCAQPAGELSRRFVADLKCVSDKRLERYNAMEIELINSLYAIRRQNHTDSGLELKYICCSLIKYKRAFVDEAQGCGASGRQTMEELIGGIIANDISLLCDDEEQLTSKLCPQLKPLRLAKTQDAAATDGSTGMGPSGTALYLVATLGEPEV